MAALETTLAFGPLSLHRVCALCGGTGYPLGLALTFDTSHLRNWLGLDGGWGRVLGLDLALPLPPVPPSLLLAVGSDDHLALQDALRLLLHPLGHIDGSRGTGAGPGDDHSSRPEADAAGQSDRGVLFCLHSFDLRDFGFDREQKTRGYAEHRRLFPLVVKKPRVCASRASNGGIRIGYSASSGAAGQGT